MMTRAILAGIMVLALAAPAQAATVSSNGAVVEFTAAPGEANNLRVTFGPGEVVIQDATAPTPGAGCIPAEFNGVTCFRTAPTTLVLELGDGSDRMIASPTSDTATSFQIAGGPGNDTLWGARGNDKISGGGGNDSLYGDGGEDVLLSGGSGKDRIQGQGVLRGGPGKDFIDALFSDDGSKSIVSRLFGDAGNDRFITGNGAKEIVNCGRGKDQVTTTLPTGKRDKRDKLKRNCERRL